MDALIWCDNQGFGLRTIFNTVNIISMKIKKEKFNQKLFYFNNPLLEKRLRESTFFSSKCNIHIPTAHLNFTLWRIHTTDQTHTRSHLTRFAHRSETDIQKNKEKYVLTTWQPWQLKDKPSHKHTANIIQTKMCQNYVRTVVLTCKYVYFSIVLNRATNRHEHDCRFEPFYFMDTYWK